jgi:DNA-binding transcriptional MerR regulator
MVRFPLTLYCDHPEPQFELGTAVSLARVSIDFVHRCEREGLITVRTLFHGERGLCFSDVRKLKLVRHLHDDMGLELEAVDLILQYRNRISSMQRRLEKLEEALRQKEQAYQRKIMELQERLETRGT